MSHTTLSNPNVGDSQADSHGPSPWMRPLWLTFIAGPQVLLTRRISGKCAAAVAMMCSPSLLFFIVTTVPGAVFRSPDQNEYFHFARMLETDPTRWSVYLLVSFCAVLSLAVPASIPNALDPTEV
jgi:hypothetical protein